MRLRECARDPVNCKGHAGRNLLQLSPVFHGKTETCGEACNNRNRIEHTQTKYDKKTKHKPGVNLPYIGHFPV